MPSDPHLAALHRADKVSAEQSPFGDTFQIVSSGNPGPSLAAHDMKQGQADVELQDGGLIRTELLSFAVLKTVVPQPMQPRSIICVRRRNWIIQTVSGEDPAQLSWKFSATPA